LIDGGGGRGARAGMGSVRQQADRNRWGNRGGDDDDVGFAGSGRMIGQR